VNKTVNRLFECGCNVIYERDIAVHTSGHASREEQKLLLCLAKPKYFMPVHGEYRHLVRHSQLATEMGVPPGNIFVLHNGDVLEIDSSGKARRGSRVESGAVLVDGVMLGEFEGSLLRERRELSENGILVISIVIDGEYNLISEIQVDSRGSIYGFDKESMRPDVESAVDRALQNARSCSADEQSLQTEIRKRTREILGKNYRAYPGIMPIINMISEKPRGGSPLPSRKRRGAK